MTAIQTPCVNVCALNHATGQCAGCGRTLDEIAAWLSMSDREREEIMRALPARMEAARGATPVAR